MARFGIVGGGIVGLSVALGLRLRARRAEILLFDPAAASGAEDSRAYAVTPRSRDWLDALGCWSAIAAHAQPIRRMAITDSRLNDPVRPVLLGLEPDTGETASGALAHMVPGAALRAALLERARTEKVAIVEAAATLSPDGDPAPRPTLLCGARSYGVDLVVAADGRQSPVRAAAGIGWIGRTYPQRGIVATITHARDHDGVATQHFLPGGPFAILPLPLGGSLGHRSSIVWSERADLVASLEAGDRDDWLAGLRRRAGLRLGEIRLETPPRSHPLAVGIARRFVKGRIVLVGDAAHIIHPLAGQGLNLGLADAAALVEAVAGSVSLGLDPADRPALEAYERARRPSTVMMMATTDGLNRLFSNDAGPLRLIRDVGLGLVDRSRRLKRIITTRAAISG